MKVLIQRVKGAKVETEGRTIGEIGQGFLILLGVGPTDTEKEIDYLVEKMTNLRVFEDEPGKMNLSLIDIKGELLVVSQFTLYADCKKGRRPSFTDAAPPTLANDLYTKFVQKCQSTGLKTAQGKFGAMMDITLTNWGPVTIMLEAS